ncbi:DUF932 domain-containing protein [Caulobacter sp. CCNWLY153]|uniref:DUF932 domain-containing protein n=1 Tax=unclassified Caulobacter TaxID=2648921 RepID=UPI002FF1C539
MSYIRTQRFGSGAVILRNRDGSALTLDQITASAPSVVASEPHESRSDRYAFIPTRDVLAGLMSEGFAPFEVRQGGSKDADKRAKTKHMIRMRHASAGAVEIARGDRIAPEIIILNSHDGSSSYQLTAGAFRFVCTNGLIAGDAFEHMKVAHKGDVMGEVIDAAFRVVQDFPRLVDGAQEMAGVQLSQGERLAFARAAAMLRWEPEKIDGEERQTAPIPAEQLLRIRRDADAPGDLWRTMNRVQESLIGGGQTYSQPWTPGPGRQRRPTQRRVREVKGIDQNRQINRALWTLAEEMTRLKAAA